MMAICSQPACLCPVSCSLDVAASTMKSPDMNAVHRQPRAVNKLKPRIDMSTLNYLICKVACCGPFPLPSPFDHQHRRLPPPPTTVWPARKPTCPPPPPPTINHNRRLADRASLSHESFTRPCCFGFQINRCRTSA